MATYSGVVVPVLDHRAPHGADPRYGRLCVAYTNIYYCRCACTSFRVVFLDFGCWVVHQQQGLVLLFCAAAAQPLQPLALPRTCFPRCVAGVQIWEVSQSVEQGHGMDLGSSLGWHTPGFASLT
ncbi:hypothetical protein MPTK1_5g07090 [Marchantia polymorpha subsp. ruderalis]|uniref:Uncharacterized protein n=2 Tax=Marchantia polymorpha TaxID=3197 RepID=A0AAF6BFT2_MARPO|nr:hypothetical protein MARPO_0136s0012 [Marchantia polymorpha]BBN10866.1 hypothetical protein Mp_5g07090 [Marchantia polymorpha subsp. ruderalis]|eukprot:PTQ29684.1 hypothetical protein MARPO_0136s0012 [Marchantia polymorpha]